MYELFLIKILHTLGKCLLQWTFFTEQKKSFWNVFEKNIVLAQPGLSSLIVKVRLSNVELSCIVATVRRSSALRKIVLRYGIVTTSPTSLVQKGTCGKGTGLFTTM